MPDTQNETLALAMGWELLTDFDPALGEFKYWRSPDGLLTCSATPCGLPDFYNDPCAAVKYTLPFLQEKVRVDIVCNGPLRLLEKIDGNELFFVETMGPHVESGWQPTLSQALAAAVLVLEGGEKNGKS